MVDLDRARSRPRERGAVDVPLVFEAVELKPALVRAGWLAVVVLVAVAITLALRFSSGVGELAGGVLASVGVLLAFVLVRCRRFETSVGTVQVEAGLGLAHRKVPVGMVGGVAVTVATSWRRAYADQEVRLEVAGETLALPSQHPEGLLEALGASGRVGELTADR